MRSSLLIAVAASLMAGLMAGCGSDPEETDPLAESLALWQDMKAADDGRYGYTRTFQSFSGAHGTTSFVVEDDVVVRRAFEVYDRDDRLLESFDEQGDEVGSNQGAAPVYTIDELYEVCRDEVLTQDPEANQILLELRADGILDHCLYVPINCADDCAVGVDIASIDMSL